MNPPVDMLLRLFILSSPQMESLNTVSKLLIHENEGIYKTKGEINYNSFSDFIVYPFKRFTQCDRRLVVSYNQKQALCIDSRDLLLKYSPLFSCFARVHPVFGRIQIVIRYRGHVISLRVKLAELVEMDGCCNTPRQFHLINSRRFFFGLF